MTEGKIFVSEGKTTITVTLQRPTILIRKKRDGPKLGGFIDNKYRKSCPRKLGKGRGGGGRRGHRERGKGGGRGTHYSKLGERRQEQGGVQFR